MHSKFGFSLLFVLLYAQAVGATVIYQRIPLKDSIADAAVVAQVRIRKVEDRRFNDADGPGSCGTDYVVDVLTTFKGEALSQRTFSVLGEPHAIMFHEVKPGDELLVLLTPRRKGESPQGEATDVIRRPSRAEVECRSQLSATTLLRGDAGGFPLIVRPKTPAAGEKDVVWIAYNTTRTEMPEWLMRDRVHYELDCTEPECSRASRRMVPWQPLKTEIQRWLQDPTAASQRPR